MLSLMSWRVSRPIVRPLVQILRSLCILDVESVHRVQARSRSHDIRSMCAVVSMSFSHLIVKSTSFEIVATSQDTDPSLIVHCSLWEGHPMSIHRPLRMPKSKPYRRKTKMQRPQPHGAFFVSPFRPFPP